MPWITINGNHVLIGDDVPKAVRAKRPMVTEMSSEEVERIAAKAQRLKSLPTITSAKGEQITISISSNPFHHVLAKEELQRPYAVETHVNGELNDHQQASTMEHAIKKATAWHRVLVREEAQAMAKQARGKRH